MRGRSVVAAGLLCLVVSGCDIDDEVAQRLTDTATTFTAPASWSETRLAKGPVDGFPLLQTDGPFCFTEICVHARRQWLHPEDVPLDIDAITAAVATTAGWEPTYTPDCAVGGRSPEDLALPEMIGCVWEADTGDGNVLVALRRFGDFSPYDLNVSVQGDDHVRRKQESPVVAAREREAAAALIAVADRFRAPDDWRQTHEDVRPDPPDCLQLACLTVTREWFDARLDAALVTTLLTGAGYEIVEAATSCVAGPDEQGLQEDCRFVAAADRTRVELVATAIGPTFMVQLSVTSD